MIVTGSEQETIDQWRRWGDLAVAHRRAVACQRCKQAIDAGQTVYTPMQPVLS